MTSYIYCSLFWDIRRVSFSAVDDSVLIIKLRIIISYIVWLMLLMKLTCKSSLITIICCVNRWSCESTTSAPLMSYLSSETTGRTLLVSGYCTYWVWIGQLSGSTDLLLQTRGGRESLSFTFNIRLAYLNQNTPIRF